MEKRRKKSAHQLELERCAPLEFDMLYSMCLLQEAGHMEEFLEILCEGGNQDFAIHTNNPNKWRFVYRFAVAVARRYKMTPNAIGNALYCYANTFDSRSDWNKRVQHLEASVAEYRKSKNPHWLYKYSLLELARAYVEQDFEWQLKQVLVIASELIVLEVKEEQLDKDDIPEIQRKAAEKLATLGKGAA